MIAELVLSRGTVFVYISLAGEYTKFEGGKNWLLRQQYSGEGTNTDGQQRVRTVQGVQVTVQWLISVFERQRYGYLPTKLSISTRHSI